MTSSAQNSLPTALPKYIYKILPSTSFPSPSPPSPSALPPALPLSALDARDGFIHLSTSFQLLGTLNNFFAKEESVWILRIEYARVGRFVKWEDTKGRGPEEVGGCWDIEDKPTYFPHIYNNDPSGLGEQGLKLGREEVEAVGRFERRGEKWSPRAWPWSDEDAPCERR